MDLKLALLVANLVIDLALIGAGLFFRSYLSEKGKHLATKEDIAQITRIAEEVKHQFVEEAAQREQDRKLIIEAFKAREGLRTLAGEVRLKTLQDAFVKWRELWDALRSAQLQDVMAQTKEWWNQNCIYLDDPARQALNKLVSAIEGWSLTAIGSGKTNQNAELPEKLMKQFWATADAIFEAAQLPALAQKELSDMSEKANSIRGELAS